jgi:hypothetical protein
VFSELLFERLKGICHLSPQQVEGYRIGTQWKADIGFGDHLKTGQRTSPRTRNGSGVGFLGVP